MSEPRPRRSKVPQAPDSPTGYRQTRRGSKSAKSAKRAEKQHAVVMRMNRAGRATRNLVIVATRGAGLAVLIIVVLLLIATGVNQWARWNATRIAEQDKPSQVRERQARENLLVIGVKDDKAMGFLALRIDRKGGQVFGVAIPDGAFIDIPGLGFERVGEAYGSGPDVALASISNYLTVPFRSYIAVNETVYADAVARQSVAGLPKAVTESNLSTTDLEALSKDLAGIEQKNVALVPLPVKPIKLGDQTYYEPQRQEVADLLKSWWGVDASQEQGPVRVIVYNGAGTPGIAGEAAQQLIRAGFRVVDTKNADSFDYVQTRVVVRRGNRSRGDDVAKALGAGKVTVEPSSSEVTDVIVIIGKDYVAPDQKAKGTK